MGDREGEVWEFGGRGGMKRGVKEGGGGGRLRRGRGIGRGKRSSHRRIEMEVDSGQHRSRGGPRGQNS